MVQPNRRGKIARRRTMNSSEFPKLKLTMSLGEFCGPNKGSLSLCQRIIDPGQAYWFRFTPVGTSFLPHQGDKRGTTLPHKPITSFQMALLVCGLTAAPCPCLYEHRQSCPGVTQAVSYVPCFLHPTRRWSRLTGNIQVLAIPFSTQIPDRAVSHTSVQPIDCLMSNPYPGDTNWIPGTSGWREGVTAPSLDTPGTCAWLPPGNGTCNLPPYTAGRPKIYPCLHL